MAGWLRVWMLIAALGAVVLALNQVFNLSSLLGLTVLSNQYFYTLLALLLPPVFLLKPTRAEAVSPLPGLLDLGLALLMLALTLWFAWNGERILDGGWEYAAPLPMAVASLLLWALVLEVTRRAGGGTLLGIVAVVSLYPLYTHLLPVIQGKGASLVQTALFHAMSEESVLGVPMRAFANLVIGFLVFGVALQHTGGGRFFINLAFSLLGGVRGGPAKVAVFSSGLMGSMSGSVVTNVLTTGVLTIPAMRRVGFDREYAGGVETCASTGGVLMPPIMGATAFVMASFLETTYVTIAAAAVAPSLLYFLGLFVQVDSYAARRGLKGLEASALPRFKETLKQGWHFIAVFSLLIWMLIYLKQEAAAPFYATALLLAVNYLAPGERWGLQQWGDFIVAVGKLLAELAAILAGVGMIVGALALTGMTGTIANDLVHLAGGNPLALLAMGALTSFILGMGMTVTAAYILLAVSLAPALINSGLDPLAVHLFILYWGMLSYITPPVALGAYAAATVAGARPFQTGLRAMHLGSIIYFIPFFFVLQPALLFRTGWSEGLLALSQAGVGVWLAASGLQGHLAGVGSLDTHPVLKWPARALLAAAGLLLALPGVGTELLWSGWRWQLIAAGVLLALLCGRGRVLLAR